MSFNRLGLDVGSTTLKVVLLNKEDRLIFSAYRRHNARIVETLVEVLQKSVLEPAVSHLP